MEMFDEQIETKIASDGTVETKRLVTDEETIRQMEAEQEMERAVGDLVTSAREFFEMRSESASDYERPGIVWWRRLEALTLADSRLKDAFCGRDRSPRSIRAYHRFKLKMVSGRRYRVDA
jgi:hypothetical protein